MTNRTAFTPGPWIADWNTYPIENFCETQVTHKGAVVSVARAMKPKQCAANANLIAAAPEMHKQIKGAITIIGDLQPDDLSNHALIMLREVLNNLKQVIAKAEGGQQ